MAKLDLGIKKETLNHIIIKKNSKNNKILFFSEGWSIIRGFSLFVGGLET
jgi:hypothetical protein